MVFDKLTNFLILPLYYFIHHNIIFGFIQKYFIKTFRFKKFKFFLNIEDIPLSNYSSFLFNTYEYRGTSEGDGFKRAFVHNPKLQTFNLSFSYFLSSKHKQKQRNKKKRTYGSGILD